MPSGETDGEAFEILGRGARRASPAQAAPIKGAVGFDFDGAEFTHVEGRVTFEVLLASFGLDDDPALAAIGQAVHYLDTGGIPVADARGLETILRGLKKNAAGDTELAAQAARVFDSLYSGYAQQGAG